MPTIEEHELHYDIMAILSLLIQRFEIQTDHRYVINVSHVSPEMLNLVKACEAKDIAYNEWRFDRYRMGVFSLGWGELITHTFNEIGGYMVTRLEPHYREVFNYFERVGRCWRDAEEYDDFMLLCELRKSGERLSIDIF